MKLFSETLIEQLERECTTNGIINYAALCGCLEGQLTILEIELMVFLPHAYDRLKKRVTERCMHSEKVIEEAQAA